MCDTTVVMKIKNDGEITWTPSGIYKTHCETDVTFYPFDTQECDVIVTSWGYTSIELSLYVDTEAVRLSYLQTLMSMWKAYRLKLLSNKRRRPVEL
jgi:hypothetical protein